MPSPSTRTCFFLTFSLQLSEGRSCTRYLVHCTGSTPAHSSAPSRGTTDDALETMPRVKFTGDGLDMHAGAAVGAVDIGPRYHPKQWTSPRQSKPTKPRTLISINTDMLSITPRRCLPRPKKVKSPPHETSPNHEPGCQKTAGATEPPCARMPPRKCHTSSGANGQLQPRAGDVQTRARWWVTCCLGAPS